MKKFLSRSQIKLSGLGGLRGLTVVTDQYLLCRQIHPADLQVDGIFVAALLSAFYDIHAFADQCLCDKKLSTLKAISCHPQWYSSSHFWCAPLGLPSCFILSLNHSLLYKTLSPYNLFSIALATYAEGSIGIQHLLASGQGPGLASTSEGLTHYCTIRNSIRQRDRSNGWFPICRDRNVCNLEELHSVTERNTRNPTYRCSG